MQNFFYLLIILLLLLIIFPVLIKNNDFNTLISSLWGVMKGFSTWIINEIAKIIKLITHVK